MQTQQAHLQDIYETLVEQSHELICLHTVDSAFLFANSAAKRITGYAPEELIGQRAFGFFHPEDVARIHDESYQPALDGQNDKLIEYRFRRKDGSYVWLQTLTQPIFDEQGAVRYLHTSSRDISPLMALREQYRINEQILNEASEMAQIGGWRLDLASEVPQPMWSKVVYDIHELPYDYKPQFDSAIAFYRPDVQGSLRQAIAEGLRTGRGWDLRLPFVTAKGRNLWVRTIGKVEMAGGKPRHIYGVLQDITRKMAFEQKLQKTVRYLTRQKKLLEDFNQIISHNLRGPISNLRQLVAHLENAESEAEKDEYVDVLKDLSQHINTTLDDLMEVVQVRQADGLEYGQVRFEDALAQAMSALNTDILLYKASIEADFSALEQIYYPKVYLDSIVYNLLSNALKYRDPKRLPHVRLRTWAKEGLCFLSVADNGSGIDLQEYGHKLFKLHKTFHPDIKGRGFGLFMTRNQIETLGGDIEVSSAPGQGSTFTICFNRYANE